MTLLTFQKDALIEAKTEGAVGSYGPRKRFMLGPSAMAAGELAHLLFDRQDRDRIHENWHTLISGQNFTYRAGLAPNERTALSYERLRLVNEAVGDPADLANDPYRLASLHEWTGPVDGGLCTVASIHYNLFLGSLLDHDADGRDLSAFTSMKCTGTFLCTELEHGNDVASMETTAVLDRTTNGFVLDTPTPGARKFMPNTSTIGGPKSAVVAARLVIDGRDHGVFLFLTPLSDENGHKPGVKVQPLPQRTGTPVDHSLTAFDHVWLPREALLEAAHGRLDAKGELNSNLGNRRRRLLRSISRITMGKLCMSAGTLGMSRTALAIAVRYAHNRFIAGTKPGERVALAAHRSHHGRLIEKLAMVYAMTFLHRTTVARWAEHTDEDRAEVERLVAIAKGWITWQARDITIECRERCGAQGLFPANGLADLPQNIEGGITAEGDNLVIWVKAAAEMVLGHEVARRGAGQLPAGERDLTDLHFLRALLAEAEALWQDRARTALREGPSGNPLSRWNETSPAALEMVSVHARLQAADAFICAVAQAMDPSVRYLLERLCLLFLLRQINEHTGDLLADGHMSGDQVRELPRTVNAVIAELAPHMMTLVDAFDIPAEILASVPIAGGAYIDQYLDTAAPRPAPLPV
ncbi:acyl-CoA dehydrogenase [Streptomyces sp. NPDC059837]|uniref:acyl-CoA dehydrogenase n=1 Tax=unclassified Streptomyces TaxID=2593676 RepID=UPI00224F1EE8|nr:acyl-CoA dehydrogenase [Streptomyces sp. NBC_00268]MCX5192108.1 acyl-CoA oxidase [Streptomyces sp. NBC_00268]